jgi:nucleotide-binding universal stress UspA family protein
MHIQSILALTDFSVSAENAIERAAMIAKQHRAVLKLMYFSETENLQYDDPFARLKQRARQLSGRHDVPVRAVAHTAGILHDVVAKARDMDLLVLDERPHQALSQFWRGSMHAHLIRRCRCPILVVKGESHAPYARVLVVVDFNGEWRALARYARRFQSGAALIVRSVAAGPAYRREQFRKACRRIEQGALQLAGSLIGLTRYLQTASSGTEADELLIVGKSRRPAWLDILCGNPAERRVKQARGDALVVPADHALQHVESPRTPEPAVADASPESAVPPLTLRARPFHRGLA